eukprot:Seg4158.1 transcript_id=Seg4158.1/GoldUCD/mRNA.D3Y31 product="hypothetical protein" pseudo=true protein_id=Seg4158.1/GoldUCD/D3Y31
MADNDVPKLRRTDSQYVDPRMPLTQIAFIEELHKQLWHEPRARNGATMSSGCWWSVGGAKGEVQTRKRKMMEMMMAHLREKKEKRNSTS